MRWSLVAVVGGPEISAAPYFLDRKWPLNQYAYKNKYYSKLRHHHIITLPRTERTIEQEQSLK